MTEREYWLGFSGFPGIGPIKFDKLRAQFGSAKDAWEASSLDLSKIIGQKLTQQLDKFRNEFSVAEYVKKLQNLDVSFLILTDKEYPNLLSKIKNPPFLLYIKGDIEILRRQSADQNDTSVSIAVVGTRRTTQYGREVTKILTEGLVAAGFTIVSGLAIGVDSISHKTAIDNGGKTIAVLGCGVDCCYPMENLNIYNSIVKSGNCIVSEFPLTQRPTKGSFPARNRIIAGLSQAVLVTEGAEDSGSLITAKLALSFGRRVFAVPGPITSNMSKGPYKLIGRGAKLVTSARDILDELKITNSKSQASNKLQNTNFKTATEEERKILKLLESEPLHFDEIVRKSGFQSSKLSSLFSIMEIKGLIKSLNSGQFSIAS